MSDSAAHTKPPEAKERKYEILKVSGLPSYYSNHLQVGTTVNDLRLIFGEITDVTTESVEITPRVSVTITFAQAKALHALVGNALKAFEDSNGPIKTVFKPIPTIESPKIPRIEP